MKIDDFKTHVIMRSSPTPRKLYQGYRDIIKKDFCGRCAYCNLSDKSITTPFEIDHFIPKQVCEKSRPELITDYQNLVYSCKKCNVAKSNQFSGDIHSTNPTNELFYDPVLVDYNTIFFRNTMGSIDSDDEKGKKMISRLKLYRPIHTLGWICEKLCTTANKLENAIAIETNSDKKEKLKEALNNIEHQYRKYNNIFIASYND